MEKETLSEFGYFIIAIIVALVLMTSITGTTFLNNTKNTIDKSIPACEAQGYASDEAFVQHVNAKSNQE